MGLTEKGLTLIELIISLAVIAIIVSLLYSVFFVTLHTFGFGERQRDVVASAGWAIETMVKEIRQARAIYNVSNIYVTNKFYATDIEILTGNGLEWFCLPHWGLRVQWLGQLIALVGFLR